MDSKSIQENDKSTKGLKIPSLLCKDFVLQGDIKILDAIRVEGKIIGNVLEAEHIVIGETGSVQGNVNAKKLIIFGHIEGDITASHSVSIKSTGTVQGNLSTAYLSIEKGGMYEGKVIMNASLDKTHKKH